MQQYQLTVLLSRMKQSSANAGIISQGAQLKHTLTSIATSTCCIPTVLHQMALLLSCKYSQNSYGQGLVGTMKFARATYLWSELSAGVLSLAIGNVPDVQLAVSRGCSQVRAVWVVSKTTRERRSLNLSKHLHVHKICCSLWDICSGMRITAEPPQTTSSTWSSSHAPKCYMGHGQALSTGLPFIPIQLMTDSWVEVLVSQESIIQPGSLLTTFMQL